MKPHPNNTMSAGIASGQTTPVQSTRSSSLRYITYARRSSDENSNRQVQSTDDQLAAAREIAQRQRLTVVAEFEESMSAKAPGRPIFNQMVKMIERGQADSILCWKLDRLSRNPVDAGTLRWLLQNNIIKEIRTPHQIYRPEDNALLTAVENAMAEQYIHDLRFNVERGMKSKCEKGGFPYLAPAGYINDVRSKEIEVDPDRFPLLRKAWQILLTGSQSVPEIHSLLVNQWGYRSRITRCSPDGRFSLNSLYRVFRNPFYMGLVTFKGEVYTHRFPIMVTRQEFEQAQVLLRRRAHKQPVHPTRQRFAYTGMLMCATCGYWVTAEKSKGHTYYHCTNKFGICTKKGMREEAIDEHIDEVLQQITLPAGFVSLANRVLARTKQEEQEAEQHIVDSREKTKAIIDRQKDALLSLYIQGHLEQEEYLRKKQQLSVQVANLDLDKEEHAQGTNTADATLENAFLYTTQARSLFRRESPQYKRLVAAQLGSYWFNNGQLEIELNKVLQPVRSNFKKLENKFRQDRTAKCGELNLLTVQGASDFNAWRATFKEYRTFIRENDLHFPPLDIREN